jgi:hypothetical protein
MRSTPKDAGATRKLWAYVTLGGSIILGAGGLRVTKIGTGQYAVTLPNAMAQGVGAIVTTNPATTTVGTVVNSSASGFTVSTFNPATSANLDSAFTIEVNLP